MNNRGKRWEELLQETQTNDGVLDEIVAHTRQRPAVVPISELPPVPLVAECIDARHPTLAGRVLLRWTDAQASSTEQWVPTLMGLPVRAGDRVLLLQAANWDEPVVTGVIDGFRNRPEVEREAAATLEIKKDEAVRIAAADGTELIEVFQGEAGPVVRLMHKDVDLEMPGTLRMSAEAIEFEARQGQVKVTASDDVVVKGEVIHLN